MRCLWEDHTDSVATSCMPFKALSHPYSSTVLASMMGCARLSHPSGKMSTIVGAMRHVLFSPRSPLRACRLYDI